ncbi:hypothetical protein MKZ38_002492 [Zalerion maritima]|uniref:Uncharacterized protein n=1 Tax=Zalerion maritima TaxID=339359 RepID=A0AAD5RVM9_9PEZI|nr:hypothetical protein MKZ38_002492 [Zalerion maritima]
MTEIDPLPAAKKSRLTRTDAQRPMIEDESEQEAKSTTESVQTSVPEWLESVGSDRENRCRSDSTLRHSDDDPNPRELTRSVPDMSYVRDAAGTDAGSVAPSDVAGSGRSSGRTRSLVEDAFYRSRNLAMNGIYMPHVDEEFPSDIASLVHDVGKERDPPEQDFRTNLYPYLKPSESLKRSDKQPMSTHAVPSSGSKLKVSNPIPDMLYGYNNEAFPQQRAQLISNDLDYYMRKVRSFLLQEPKYYLEFRRYVRNTIDCGKDRRPKEVWDS